MQFRSAEEIKNQANQEYKSGHYADAIRLYSQAIGKPIHSLVTKIPPSVVPETICLT